MKGKVLKKVLMVALTASLVVTPVITAGAAGSETGSGSSSSSTSGSGSSSSSTSTSDSSLSNTSSSGSSGSDKTKPAAPATSEIKIADGTVLKTTIAGSYSAKNVPGIVVTAPKAVVNAALKVGEGEQAYVNIADSNYGPKAQESLKTAAGAFGSEVGAVLDIFAGTVKDGKFESVAKATKLIDFKVGAPSNFALKAGYEYAVVRIEADGTVTVLPDWDNDPTTVTFYTDTFGVFGMIQVPAGTVDNVKVAQYQQANS